MENVRLQIRHSKTVDPWISVGPNCRTVRLTNTDGSEVVMQLIEGVWERLP